MKVTTYIVAAIAGTTSAVPRLLERQDFDQTWDDEFIPVPQNFEVRNAGAQCDFQLAYERFSVDNRYDVTYLAEYADGSQTAVNGIGGCLPRDNIWLVDGLPDDRALQVVFFRDICRSGSAPTSFRANFALRDGFTYENRWTTGSFDITPGGLPAAPQSVAVSAAPRDSTVTWSPVQGATGYVVMVEWFTSSEVGPVAFVWARELGADATSFNFNREFTRAAVLAEGDGPKAFTALSAVEDAFP